jgi:hypothetical protein
MRHCLGFKACPTVVLIVSRLAIRGCAKHAFALNTIHNHVIPFAGGFIPAMEVKFKFTKAAILHGIESAEGDETLQRG